jgi:hypothetical protein
MALVHVRPAARRLWWRLLRSFPVSDIPASGIPAFVITAVLRPLPYASGDPRAAAHDVGERPVRSGRAAARHTRIVPGPDRIACQFARILSGRTVAENCARFRHVGTGIGEQRTGGDRDSERGGKLA